MSDPINITNVLHGKGDINYANIEDSWQKAVYTLIDPTPSDGTIKEDERKVAAQGLNHYDRTTFTWNPGRKNGTIGENGAVEPHEVTFDDNGQLDTNLFDIQENVDQLKAKFIADQPAADKS